MGRGGEKKKLKRMELPVRGKAVRPVQSGNYRSFGRPSLASNSPAAAQADVKDLIIARCSRKVDSLSILFNHGSFQKPDPFPLGF